MITPRVCVGRHEPEARQGVGWRTGSGSRLARGTLAATERASVFATWQALTGGTSGVKGYDYVDSR